MLRILSLEICLCCYEMTFSFLEVDIFYSTFLFLLIIYLLFIFFYSFSMVCVFHVCACACLCLHLLHVFMHVEAGHQPQTLFPRCPPLLRGFIYQLCVNVCEYVHAYRHPHSNWSRLAWALRTELGSWKSSTLF